MCDGFEGFCHIWDSFKMVECYPAAHIGISKQVLAEPRKSKVLLKEAPKGIKAVTFSNQETYDMVDKPTKI